MLGQLEFTPGGRGRGQAGEVYGMPVLRVQADPEGWLGARRLRRAGSELRRGGVVRTLLPKSFAHWEILERFGLRGVEPAPFLRAQAPRLAMESLRRRDVDPERATVALSGVRADRDMARAAVELCPRVRRLVIAAPDGGRLAQKLREEFGVPILPADQPAQMELRFQPSGRTGPGPYLELYGTQPNLDGAALSAPGLGEEDREDLALLCALWERGKLDVASLKFT